MIPRQRQFAPTHTKTRQLRVIGALLFLVIIFAIPTVRSVTRRSVSAVGITIARSTHAIGGLFVTIGTTVRSKYSLANENDALKAQVSELNARLAQSDQTARENVNLKSAMGRNESAHFILATVIEKPPHSLYDTLVIDGGSSVGFSVGQIVYANGETPIGSIEQVLPSTAIVKLYSAPGEETEARLMPSNIDVTLTGKGGGNFYTTIPHDVTVSDGATVMTKETNASTIAVFQKVVSDARDSFQTILLGAPLNIYELNFVEVRQ